MTTGSGNGALSLAQLQALVTHISQDTGIQVELHPSVWAYDPPRKTILVAQDDLAAHGTEACAGIIYHEVAHYYITRYLQLMDGIEFPSRKALSNLLNAIEDTRIENWIQQRYPGSRDMLDRSREIHKRGRDDYLKLIPFEQFLLGCIVEWHLDWRPMTDSYNILPQVQEALEITRDARKLFHQTTPQPGLELDNSRDETRRLHRQTVVPRLTRSAKKNPSLKEMNVRISQIEAMNVAERVVIPVAKSLLEADLASLNHAIANGQISEEEIREGGDRELAGRLREAILENPDAVPPSNPSEVVEEAVDIILGNPPPNPVGIESPMITEGLDDNPQLALEPPPSQPPTDQVQEFAQEQHRRIYDPIEINTEYEDLLKDVADQITSLSKALEEQLIPRKRLRTTSGHASGHRVDLRSLMEYETRPELYNKIWQRRTVPDRRDSAFLLMVDLSGSMQDEGKIRNATLGVILLAETLTRLEIPHSIVGFHYDLVEISSFGEGVTDEVKEKIVEMESETKENWANFDGPILLKCAEKLNESSAVERYLIVISDGRPRKEDDDGNVVDGGDELKEALLQIEGPRGEGIHLIGLGLGPETEHVEEFYTNSVANIPVEDFSEEISNLLNQILVLRLLN